MGTIYSQIICHTIECLRCYFFHNILLFVHLVYFFVCRKQSFVRIIQVLNRNNQNCLFHIKRKLFNNVIQTQASVVFLKKNHVKEILQCNQNLIQIFGLRYITFFSFVSVEQYVVHNLSLTSVMFSVDGNELLNIIYLHIAYLT